MFKYLRPSQFLLINRQYTSKAKRSLLSQDPEKIKVYEPVLSASDKSRVYVWGYQETGALGVCTSVKKSKERYTEVVDYPTRLKFAENCSVSDIAGGYGFSAFAVKRSDGETLFGTGINADSQLGLQENSYGGRAKCLDVIIYPTAIKLPKQSGETDEDMTIRCMSAGRAHLVVVTKNGTIFLLGHNGYGQCGRTIVPNEVYKGSNIINRIEKNSFIALDDEIISVECGQDHTMFLTKAGRVYSCGWGADGQTGKGNYQTSGQIDQVKGDILHEEIIKITCSADCVLALNKNGDVFGWGNTEYGQLNDYENDVTQINSPIALKLTKGLGKIIDVAAGGSFCMLLNEAGLVFTWGFGVLGFGPIVEHSSKPQQLLPPLFGRNDFSDKTYVKSIGCGTFHMNAINSDGDLFMWGKNRFGCLGLGHRKDQFFPFKTAVNGKVFKVVCGIDHTLALCKPFV